MSSHEESDRSDRRGHRAARLEHVVAEWLECDLLPSLEDPALQELHVLHVEVKNLACIRATLRSSCAEVPPSDVVNAALKRVEGRFRSQLAELLRLKRMPELRLSYVPLPPSCINKAGEQNGGAHA